MRDQFESNDPRAPLASFGGVEPCAPDWFKRAVLNEPERGFTSSQESELEVLIWGELGRPGLLLVHGTGAHADWWSFIAPLLAETHRVAAFSLPGNGSSDWREEYSSKAFDADARAVCGYASLSSSGDRPIYLGHSRGGTLVLECASRHPEDMSAVILVDTQIGPLSASLIELAREFANSISRPPKPRPLLEAVSRFRFLPPQSVAAPYAADLIARRSLRSNGSKTQNEWVLRADPDYYRKGDANEHFDLAHLVNDLAVPLARIYGEQSVTVSRDSNQPQLAIDIGIPEAGHHIMVDQPVALVSVIRTLLPILGNWAFVEAGGEHPKA